MNSIQKVYRKVLSFLLLPAAMMIIASPATAQKKKKKEPEKNIAADTTKSAPGKIPSFKAFFKSGVVSDTGLFIIHHSDNNYYFEIPDSVLGKDMLIVSRRAAMSSSEIDPMVAGERAQEGIMVQWDKSPDEKRLLLKKVTTRNLIRFSGTDSAFERSVALQTLDPILLSFPVKARGAGGINAIIDIKPLYLADIKDLTPFADNPILKMLGLANKKKYKFEEDRSFIRTAKSFEKNIEVRSLLTFTEQENIYTILVNRSMVLLPENIMRPRYADDRVGYFTQNFSDYKEDRPVKQDYYIKRWRLEPKTGDREKLQKGIPVLPQKPILFYIDASTPAKWRPYIKQGVEDWQPAFEAAGFTHAIQAKDAPLNDPAFHPEDIRYSVIRYAASGIANAKGPSVIDPRSGEILESDIILYHNVLKLLADWRFAQTAANDPRVRTLNIPDSIIGEALRYVVAHEVGHALGLRHNMGASYAFPVDSLRSAHFTRLYGTTPSIMDYARNNYVAQPQDKGVRLTPPHLGVYDKYAIRWGYKPIPGAANAREEIPVLDEWINQHRDDPAYRFAEGDLNGSDPSAQRESLGNDVVKASEYGVKNARYIIDHLDEWLARPGENYDELNEHYQAVLRQYERYLSQVGCVVAGVHQHYPVQGQKINSYAYAAKEEQQRAVAFLLRQFRELPDWVENTALKQRIGIMQSNGVRKMLPVSSYLERLYRMSLQRYLLNNGKLAYLVDNELANGKSAYSADDLLNDVRQDIFKETLLQQSPGYYQRLLQSLYVDRLIGIAQSTKAGYAATDKVSFQASVTCFDMNDQLLPSLQPVPEKQEADPDQPVPQNLYFQIMDFAAADKQYAIATMMLGELEKVKAIIEKARAASNGDTRHHYSYLLKTIGQFLDNH